MELPVSPPLSAGCDGYRMSSYARIGQARNNFELILDFLVSSRRYVHFELAF
jgi:hypothetical protein